MYLLHARAILRASSLNPAGVTITYIPCPQGYVPTIATNQYLSNESCGSSSPDNIGEIMYYMFIILLMFWFVVRLQRSCE